MTGHPAASADLLVIGAGPAGVVAAITAHSTGHRAIIVERDAAERTTRGAALITPAAVARLSRLGLGRVIDTGHRIGHVRVTHGIDSTTTAWPSHPDHAEDAVVIHRAAFDTALGRAALDTGIEVWFEHEAAAPIVERGFVRGAHTTTTAGNRFEARSDYLVVADGADSRFGRALGSFRERSWPMAAAHHAEFASPLHDATELEIVVGLRDRAGTPINGYGWMFPTGTGTVDIGVALMSTSPSFQVLNPAHVLDAVVAEHRDRWHLDGTPIAPASGGRIPLGRSVGPAAGPTWLLLGDAVAAADPWSGAGIHGAIRTGAIAGDVLAEALRTGSAASLQRYPRALEDELGDGYGVGRIVNRLMGNPMVSTRVARAAARSRSSANTYLRLGTGAIRTGHLGPAELVYRIARGVGTFIPGA